jgi:hypothetical protein
MSGLDIFALVVIFFLINLFAAVIVILGGLPGKIARKRAHPHADAVNVASWIGIATGVLWPFAFVWAFLPVPNGGNAATDSTELAELRQRLEALEAATENVDTQADGEAS